MHTSLFACYDDRTTKYKFTVGEANIFSNHGIDLAVYNEGVAPVFREEDETRICFVDKSENPL